MPLSPPSPLSSALKNLKNKKSIERPNTSQISKKNMSILSPRASPSRPATFCKSPTETIESKQLKEKSIKVYESLKSKQSNDLNQVKLPINLTIKLDNPPIDDSSCDLVKINDDHAS